MAKQKLRDDELQTALGKLPEWKLANGKIVREWTFKDFLSAIVFVNKVAELAENRGHHPDIDIRYNRVKLGLMTHDAGGITANDTEMCAFLDQNL